ncbi:MAG: LuxR C-terminal-related transcriptional regulator [Chloroflexia bacterium]
MAREIGDQELLSESLNILGYVARGRRDLATAASLFRELLEQARAWGDPFWEAASLINLGNVAFDRGDYAAAERFYAESLKSVGVRGDRQNTALALANLGVARLLQGKFDAAREPVLESATICHDVGDSRVMALSLAILGLLAVGERQFRRTAQLFGAAEIVRERAGLPLPPAEVEHHERAIAAARRALGEEDFASAWAAGRALREDEILTLALERGEAAAAAPAGPAELSPAKAAIALTRREREILPLLVSGLTNRAIAAQLSVSVRTVDTHVANLLTKLGLENRVQVATWAAERGDGGRE